MQDELEDIKKGATWQNIYECLWTIATVRYVTKKQLDKSFPNEKWKKLIATKRKLNLFVQKGFLEQSPDGVFMATRKTVSLLKDFSNKNYKIIKLATGVGQRDSIYNTDLLLEIIKDPNNTLFYPVFRENKKDDQPFLIPDGAVVFKKDNMAKLVFLEIERPKPDWQNYLEDKRWKYNVIAGRTETWSEWWRTQCEKQGISHCKFEDFGFTVWCIGEFKAQWVGWCFKETL